MELQASLQCLNLYSPDPLQAARFYCATYGMALTVDVAGVAEAMRSFEGSQLHCKIIRSVGASAVLLRPHRYVLAYFKHNDRQGGEQLVQLLKQFSSQAVNVSTRPDIHF